jgi:hypothetical protein
MASPPKHAVYTATGKPVCPTCWSTLSWKGRVSREGRGWSLLETDERIAYDDALRAVATVRYPCSNTDCGTAVITSWVCGFVGKEAAAPFADRFRMAAADQTAFDLGHHRRGVWVDAAGVPKELPTHGSTRRRTADDGPADRLARTARASEHRSTGKAKPAATQRGRVSPRKGRA